MALKLIPTSRVSPNYQQRTTLDGKEYVLRFRWSERSSCWYLQVLDSNENVLTGLLRIILNLNLLRLHRTTDGVPPGAILAVDNSSREERPGFAELGDRVRLIYLTEDEL